MSTASQGQVVAAYFEKQSDAENAVRDLQTAGFRSDQIGSSFEDFDHEDYGDTDEASARQLTSADYSPNSADSSVSAHHESFWEKVKDFFSGETTDSDINDHTTTDRQYAHVSDRSYGGDWGRIPDQYGDRIRQGGGLVTVYAQDRFDEAEKILTRNNGKIDRDFSTGYGATSSGENYGTSSSDTAVGMGQGTRADITGGAVADEYSTRADSSAGYPSAAGAGKKSGLPVDREAEVYRNSVSQNANLRDLDENNEERRIQLISEVLRVRKERVARGEVRLRKQVRTETQNIQVPVTREEIVVERTPVEGERRATGQIGSDQDIRVPLTEEKVRVEKVPVVTEEVKVGKRSVSNTQNVSDQVRREELDVEGADEKLRDIKDPNRKIA